MAENELKKAAEDIILQRRLLRPVRKCYNNVDTDKVMELVKEIGSQLVKNFTIDNENGFVYEGVLKWLLGQPFVCQDIEDNRMVAKGDHYKGIYISGNTGSGKSLLLTLMAAIANYYHIYYEFDDKQIPLTWADTRTDELCTDFIMQGAEVVLKAKSAPVLCLNDFGSEPVEQLYMGNRMTIIRQLIESRADRIGQFTLITSNLPIGCEEIVNRYGSRVASRLRQMCNYFILAGTDRRI